MPVIKQYKCDGCGVDKKEANKWWALELGGRAALYTLSQAERCGIGADDLVFCGEACAIKALSKWMGERQVVENDSQADGAK